jgi:hypothetical protein
MGDHFLFWCNLFNTRETVEKVLWMRAISMWDGVFLDTDFRLPGSAGFCFASCSNVYLFDPTLSSRNDSHRLFRFPGSIFRPFLISGPGLPDGFPQDSKTARSNSDGFDFCHWYAVFRLSKKMLGFDFHISAGLMISIGNLRFLKHASIEDK